MVNAIKTSTFNSADIRKSYTYKKGSDAVFQQKTSVGQTDTDVIKQNIDVYDLYESFQTNAKQNLTSGNLNGSVEAWSSDSVEEIETSSEDKKLIAYYQGIPLEEWALTDPKYTDPETGISWYVRDGKYPYMIGEDSEKFKKLCRETGEFDAKKFGEITGLIRQLDDNTMAYIGSNGIDIESTDGKELFIDTSFLSYDMLMEMFNNLPTTDDYFDSSYWAENIKRVQSI